MVQEVFRAEGLPLDLAYVPLVESAFKPSALSRAKARGVWQFMSGTAIEERAAARLVHRRACRSGKSHPGRGEIPQVAPRQVRRLAPGAGVIQRRAGRVQRADDALEQRRLLGPSPRGSKFLPRETRNYVPLILAAVIVARNPVQCGLEITPVVRADDRHGAPHGARRPAPDCRVDRRAGAGAAGSQSRTAPVDDPGADDRLTT